MYHRTFPIAPTQQATNGALEIYVGGARAENIPQMLIGLSVLQSASADQVHAAMHFVQTSLGITIAEIEGLLARKA